MICLDALLKPAPSLEKRLATARNWLHLARLGSPATRLGSIMRPQPRYGITRQPKRVYARLCENSMTIDGPELGQIRSLAEELGIVLVLGINERVLMGRGNRSLFNSLLIIDADGSLVNHHRKLRPTYSEQMVWAQGDGAGLKAADTAVGRVGGLICWEHWMPHARQSASSQQ